MATVRADNRGAFTGSSIVGGGLRRAGKRGGGCNVDTALDGVPSQGEDTTLSLEKARELE
jgi:hypothetical protein